MESTDLNYRKKLLENPILFYVQDGFADWECSYILPILHETCCQILVVSEDGLPKTSLGGLKVQPDRSLAQVEHLDVEGLILPGGDAWNDSSKNHQILDLAERYLGEGILVAAICSATIGLARRGLLNDRKHTSNDIQILKNSTSNYHGEALYSWRLALTDGNLITSSGVGALEFTEQLMNYFELYSPDYREQWFDLYKKNVKPTNNFWMHTS
jgi:putative intracellular protease/amidase